MRQTLHILEVEGLAGISMSHIAELSGVSTKTLYNLFSNRNSLLLAAAASQLDEIEVSDALMNEGPGIPRIIALTQSAMSLFQESPDYMEAVISVMVHLSPEEEAEHNRVVRMQQWSFDALQVASEQKELLPDTDCLQLSQLLAASQWGLTFMWQKRLIPTEQLPQQAVLKHCIDLMPFCSEDRRAWLEDKMLALLDGRSSEKFAPALVATAQNG